MTISISAATAGLPTCGSQRKLDFREAATLDDMRGNVAPAALEAVVPEAVDLSQV